jgi:hypothetical protein
MRVNTINQVQDLVVSAPDDLHLQLIGLGATLL